MLGAFALIAAAIAIPALTGWNVHVRSFPPLHAEWTPRVGLGLPAAVLLGALVIWRGQRVAKQLTWRRLQIVVFVVALGWLLSLALVDGWNGIGTILNHRYEYLGTAREVTDFGATLNEYVARIPFQHENNWPVHIAGHPPGALLFFYVLVRLGLGSGLAAGLVVTVLGATIPVAVLGTVRLLGAEDFARKAAPLLVFSPAAIWIAVSGDGMFSAFAAWGAYALARSATARSRQTKVGIRRPWVRMVVWAAVAGLLFGYCVMLSYGLLLLGVLAVTVLVVARSWWPLPVAAVFGLGVVGVFAANGFAWWEAFPVVHQRYWDGIASRRPPEYWMWGNLAAFAMSAGPAIGASLMGVVSGGIATFRKRPRFAPLSATLQGEAGRKSAGTSMRVVLLLAAAGWMMIALADVSNMSRAEVERIWLPFAPWVLLGATVFSERTLRWLLVVQVVFAILLQSLLQTGW
ncbi:hypothetical protein G7068_08145 [Leucobacter viscericola]|uniref:Glycosyltransferase RgtA/B/C/D-like domain-containing protein n=1 Tax=Leucobacter viscericola TaxID=2714935 RepID=A0A6G7XK76_9MICO|nr:hypothetical protein G7068_08145 [Leucobacter viscericola]